MTRIAPCDLVIIEGFRSEGQVPRIEVRRSIASEPPIYPDDPFVIALATDSGDDSSQLPVLDLNAPAKIAEFIVSRLALA
jgi:molybdopterin-guanine dinucleotide biosynthesis protein B